MNDDLMDCVRYGLFYIKKHIKSNTSGVRGVSFQKGDGAWTAYIYHNKKRIHLGRFGDIENAALARQKAESELFTHHGITAAPEKGQP